VIALTGWYALSRYQQSLLLTLQLFNTSLINKKQ
jgi:hypothetical protein